MANPGSTRVSIPIDQKLLVSRSEAAYLLSISQRALDFLIAKRKLPTKRIGGRVLVAMEDIKKYAACDHPETIVCKPNR